MRTTAFGLIILLALSAGLPRQLTFCARSVNNYRNAPFRKRIPYNGFWSNYITGTVSRIATAIDFLCSVGKQLP